MTWKCPYVHRPKHWKLAPDSARMQDFTSKKFQGACPCPLTPLELRILVHTLRASLVHNTDSPFFKNPPALFFFLWKALHLLYIIH